ncbi:DUF2382 domain-containing protein [Actinoplanes xinjiangensis]|uniref:Uncharacterized protein (TIGR02271 family) n=1 Tax=Actinoplanes xinjiangensis TaxID=512350 RepID=A0A316G1K6_9ACTN|nr:PRC and DUF2382 domain-containing protein [Actinoplanes xinjiangensis]PWK48247.1 uncharacterized protein (TIGR02271 family) [Actinoplanes xinjiangensis]GIF38997.1 hypothetical protein Axi01nite_33080 [Actinoplanes xinjiangensis]
MITREKIDSLYGYDVYDSTGDKVGSIGAVWTDGAGEPAWASVRTGWFGLGESLVPLRDADLQGERVVVPFEKAYIKDAPDVDAEVDEPLSGDEVVRLYQYYAMSWDGSGRTGRAKAQRGRRAGQGGTDDAMTRSEERLAVGTEAEAVGRARLRKYVVTEQQQVNVPVAREEARIEREPITDANRARSVDGPDITEAEHETTLYAQRPVVDTEVVPVERVRLGTETVTEQRNVQGRVRKERIEADLPGEGRRPVD